MLTFEVAFPKLFSNCFYFRFSSSINGCSSTVTASYYGKNDTTSQRILQAIVSHRSSNIACDQCIVGLVDTGTFASACNILYRYAGKIRIVQRPSIENY